MIEYKLEEYLVLDKFERLSFFMGTKGNIALPASYWFKFDNVKKNMALYDEPDLFTLDYLIGKTEKELETFFKKRYELLKLIPQLLGIRKDKFEKGHGKDKVLKVLGLEGEYFLNFTKIDVKQLDKYLEFIKTSGLNWVFLTGVRKSIHDYAVGVESGMDSNGRKNRSGDRGELFLEEFLSNFCEKYDYIWNGQSTRKNVFEKYNIDLGDEFDNRRFDGSLFDKETRKLYLFEVNNFSSQGSKLKASGAEFMTLKNNLEKLGHEFIYITDGQGWDSDTSHLISILDSIRTVFNYKMIANGFLEEYILKKNI